MKVIATAKGYYGFLRQPGDVFEVPNGTKGSWIEPYKETKAAPQKATKDSKAENSKVEDLV